MKDRVGAAVQHKMTVPSEPPFCRSREADAVVDEVMPDTNNTSLKDILDIIDTMFPKIDTPHMTIVLRLPRSYMDQVAAILELVNRIPIELLHGGAMRAEFAASIAVLTSKLKQWETSRKESFLEYVPGLGDRHPIGLIRRALAASVEDTFQNGRASTAPTKRSCRMDRLISEESISTISVVIKRVHTVFRQRTERS